MSISSQINGFFLRCARFLEKIAVNMLFFANISKTRNFPKVFIKKKKCFSFDDDYRNIVEVDGKALRCYSVSRQHMAIE
jgi:hypothetical protein